MTQHMTLECGPSSGDPKRYWIRDIGEDEMVAIGVPEEYALLMVAATNGQYGDPKLLTENDE